MRPNHAMQRTLGGKQNEVEVARVAHTCRLLACVRFHHQIATA